MIDLSPKPPVFPTGHDRDLPYGDPCGRCGAASMHDDPRDRVCGCTPCSVCEAATGSSCAYCGRSLGCLEHRVSIERHCETYCLASPEQRATFDAIPFDGDRYRELAKQLRRDTPKPWPAPVPPFDVRRRGP